MANFENDCGQPGNGSGGGWHISIPVARDPNEMAGPAGFGGEARYVLPGETMEYTVYFENVGTAVAAAQQITIEVDLSESLDWSTFEFGEMDLAGQSMAELRGLQRGEALIPLKGRTDFVKAVVSFSEGHLQLYLRSYDKEQSKSGYWPADDYDGLLQPNDDSGRGEGHFTYRVRVREDAPGGEVLRAAAEIVFDENEMIPTDPAWWNTVYTEKPLAVTEADLAESKEITLETTGVSWTEGGGAEEYEVRFWRLDENDEAVEDWTVSAVQGTSCAFPMTLQGGTRYRWQVVAKNRYGEAEGTVFEFSTVFDGDTVPVQGGWNLLAVTRELTPEALEELLKRSPMKRETEDETFTLVQELEPGMAFWLFATEAGVLRQTGDVPADWKLPRPETDGWHLTGVAEDTAIPEWVQGLWEWNGNRFDAPSSTELLKKGRAYWFRYVGE